MKMKGLAFECSSGRVVKVHEAICWRHAEGRACFPPHEGARLPDVVVVPVAPNVHERQEGGEAGAKSPAGLNVTAAAAYNRYGGRIWGALERARTALADAGLQVFVDTNVRQRASAKFDLWERRGLPVRVEIGKAEAETGLVSIWTHREYAHAAARAVGENEEERECSEEKPPERLRGVPLDRAVAACCEVASLAKRASDQSVSCAPHVPDVVEHVPGLETALLQPSAPSPLCGRLHISVHAPSSPEESDAAEACAESPNEREQGVLQAAARPRLCVNHLKYLTGSGRYCDCGHGHLSMAEVKQLIALSHTRSTGKLCIKWLPSARASQEEEEEQEEQEQEAAAAVGGTGRGTQVLVGNLPRLVEPVHILGVLQAAFLPFGLGPSQRLRGSVAHGYVWASLPSWSLARRACQSLAGQLMVDEQVLSVSLSAGRVDALFPKLSYAERRQLRIDSVAAFSVVDQVLADEISQLVAVVIRILLPPSSCTAASSCTGSLQPPASVQASEARVNNTRAEEEVAAQTEVKAEAEEEASIFEKKAAETEEKAEEEAEEVGEWRRAPYCVTDGTACAGGMTISLMRHFAHVLAVEEDAERVTDLRHNITVLLNSGARNTYGCVRSYWGDYVRWACRLTQDVVVLDPPWGGPGYVTSGRLTDLGLGDTRLSQLTAHLLHFHAPLVVLRLPSSFDTQSFTELLMTCPHTCPRAHVHTHPLCGCGDGTEHGAGVSFYDVSVRYGRTTVLMLCRLPVAASLHTIQRLRGGMKAFSDRRYPGRCPTLGVGGGGAKEEGRGGGGLGGWSGGGGMGKREARGGKGVEGGTGKLIYRLGRCARLLAAPKEP